MYTVLSRENLHDRYTKLFEHVTTLAVVLCPIKVVGVFKVIWGHIS